MPGPMSLPNGSSRSHKLRDGDDVRVVSTCDLTGWERAYLARRRMLDTGKTAKKRERK